MQQYNNTLIRIFLSLPYPFSHFPLTTFLYFKGGLRPIRDVLLSHPPPYHALYHPYPPLTHPRYPPRSTL